MHAYEIKRGLQDNIKPENLKARMKDIFGNVEEKDGRLVSTYGALKPLVAWPEGKNLAVETTMDPGVDNQVAADTIKAYNTFLEGVTGLSAKERGKRAQKAAKAGKD
jgi:hypothetical protein